MVLLYGVSTVAACKADSISLCLAGIHDLLCEAHVWGFMGKYNHHDGAAPGSCASCDRPPCSPVAAIVTQVSRATVTLPAPPPLAPEAVDDTYPQAPTGDTVVTAANGILKNDNVPCGPDATITVVTPPAHGTLTAIARKQQSRRRAEGSFTYKPTGPALMDDSFVYEVNCNGLVGIL